MPWYVHVPFQFLYLNRSFISVEHLSTVSIYIHNLHNVKKKVAMEGMFGCFEFKKTCLSLDTFHYIVHTDIIETNPH